MGVANKIPGVSGGIVALAAGFYEGNGDAKILAGANEDIINRIKTSQTYEPI